MQDDRKQAQKIVEFLTLRQEQMATLEEAMERTRTRSATRFSKQKN